MSYMLRDEILMVLTKSMGGTRFITDLPERSGVWILYVRNIEEPI